MSQVNLMAMVQAEPAMIYEEIYAKGEIVLPKLPGKFTLYSSMGIFQKDVQDPIGDKDVAPGLMAPRECQVTWMAADDVAFKACKPQFEARVARIRAQQSLLMPQQPSILR